MRKSFAAFAIAAFTFAQPAAAVTFPTLTTIYLAPGVYDNGGANDTGTATIIDCANVSGVTTSIRILILGELGAVVTSLTLINVAHGASIRASTHGTFLSNESFLNTGAVFDGVVNVESLQSGVFCGFSVVPGVGPAAGYSLHSVRVNPHPGTVE